MPAYFTTTSTKKPKPSKSKKAAKAKAEHEAWVKAMTKGLKPDKKLVDKSRRSDYNLKVKKTEYVSGGMTTAATPKSESKVYTGERKLLGIATMHKSNLVPVFADDKDAAKDIARMRRG